MQEFGVPGIVLMENAGRGIAELLLRLDATGPVVLCCGKGNNGGDGLVIARHLANAGMAISVLLLAEPGALPYDAAINFQIVRRMATEPPGGLSLEINPGPILSEQSTRAIQSAAWIVDALFGSGLRGAVSAFFASVIAAINAAPARIIAVDLPSGLDCDTGLPLGQAVRAHHTATIAAPKKGFLTPAAAAYIGTVQVIDMGCPRSLLQ